MTVRLARITLETACTNNLIEQEPEQHEGECEDCDQDYAAQDTSPRSCTEHLFRPPDERVARLQSDRTRNVKSLPAIPAADRLSAIALKMYRAIEIVWKIERRNYHKKDNS